MRWPSVGKASVANAALHPVAMLSTTASRATLDKQATALRESACALADSDGESVGPASDEDDACSEASAGVDVAQLRASSPPAETEVHGLVIDPQDYPTAFDGDERIRLMSADDYARLAGQEIALHSPENVLFPWLHGADEAGTQQAAYFGFAGRVGCPPPKCVEPSRDHAEPSDTAAS